MLRILIILFFSGFVYMAPWGNVSGSANTAYAAELSANIMRRVNAANDYLDKAEEQIRTGRYEHAPSQLTGAQQEYSNIFNYYKGSFDPGHPALTALKARIDAVETALSAKPGGALQQPQDSDGLHKVATAGPKPLSANIMRRLHHANNELDYAFTLAAKGEDASVSIGVASEEYDNIFNYYQGSFDPEHPEIVALKNRIAEAERAMKGGMTAKDAELKIETNSRVVSDLPPQIAEALLQIGGDLAMLENTLDTAEASSNPGSYLYGLKDSLQRAETGFDQLNSSYRGQVPAGHVAYLQIERRLEQAANAVATMETRAASAASAENARRNSAYDAEAKKIMGRYSDQEPTSQLHRQNVGRMVWSTKPFGFRDQDSTAAKNSFGLTDPIFGRIYLVRSIGNTPVYSKDGGEPSENYDFGYVYRLYIDGDEKTDKFGVFLSSNLNGQAGENWTTFQFAPNPVPFDNDFRSEAEAWRRVTKGLVPGTHKVRFELWGQQGQFRSMEPISVGEFSLVVGEGESVKPGIKFPGDTYSGGDVNKIRDNMLKAIVGPVAKSRDEILRISVSSDWQPGVYNDTKKPYRKISGTLLWYDQDHDNVCRFTTVSFISDSLGGSFWTPVRFRSFAAGPEGDTECP